MLSKEHFFNMIYAVMLKRVTRFPARPTAGGNLFPRQGLSAQQKSGLNWLGFAAWGL